MHHLDDLSAFDFGGAGGVNMRPRAMNTNLSVALNWI